MLENILPDKFLYLNDGGLPFIVECVNRGYHLPYLCFIQQNSSTFINTLKERGINVEVAKPYLGTDILEWIGTLNNQERHIHWRGGIIKDSPKPVIVVPFAQNIFTDPHVRILLSRIYDIGQHNTLIFLWTINNDIASVTNVPDLDIFDYVLVVADIPSRRGDTARPSRKTRAALTRKIAEIELNQQGRILDNS